MREDTRYEVKVWFTFKAIDRDEADQLTEKLSEAAETAGKEAFPGIDLTVGAEGSPELVD